ncbi:MAG: diguanylate cyclase, partial [Cupriavidus sp.]|nr:diguanylate cyclase [Cupriavidus sp.]
SIVYPLPGGLARGEPVYLRVHSLASTPIPLSIEPLELVHRNDLAHVTWRTSVLSMMAMLVLLSLGLWVGIGERSYQYLALTLAAQSVYLLCIGGEIRAWPWLADRFSEDLRAIRFFTLLGALASSNFVAYYLSLRQQQPRLARVLRVCNVAMVALMAVSVVSDADIISLLGNIVLLVTMPGLFVAGVIGVWRRQREAYFVLLSWTPMVTVTVLRVGELQRWWPFTLWMEYWIPLCCVMSGLVLMTGVTYRIQQLRRDRDRANELATFDRLTGALARTAVEERLAAQIALATRHGRPLSVVFFDIDHFKRINDHHGHRMGDQALRIVVKRARNRLRADDLLGRYGGDELIALLPDTDGIRAEAVAEHLREAVNCRPLSVDGTTLSLSLSLGVAEWMPGESAEHLIERADAALYASKSAGRDRVTRHCPTTPQMEGAMT